nr:retrotransposon-related protein [Tanacetum cinerariifolium]
MADQAFGYDYKIEYKKGATIRGADALSRCPKFQFMAFSHPCTTLWSDIQSEVATDPYYSNLPTSLHASSLRRVIYRDGVWFRDGAILLSPSSPLLPTILDLGHSSPEGGHFGLHKTLAKIRTNFWWVGLKSLVKKYLQECQICQRFKSDSMQPAGLLQSLPIPEWVWEDISMDFIEGLPISNGFSVIMVVVDRLSKYAHFIPLRYWVEPGQNDPQIITTGNEGPARKE